jgi:phosphoglycerate dehydrogenase-like enzyme
MSNHLKVLFHYAAGQALRSRVEKLSKQGLDVVCCPEGADTPFDEEIEDTQILWHVLQPVTAEIIGRAPKLKLIQKLGVGVNTIDLEAAKARNIAVCNMPGTNSQAVAEMTLYLMLGALRQGTSLDRACRSGSWYLSLDRACRSGSWYLDAATKNALGEISGRTVGFVGFGGIPKILAPILQAMGARVIYYARQPKTDAYEYAPLDSLLEQSDIVTLHVPATPETKDLINRSRLASMKTGAILINTARGELVDEAALRDALESGHLSRSPFRRRIPCSRSIMSWLRHTWHG